MQQKRKKKCKNKCKVTLTTPENTVEDDDVLISHWSITHNSRILKTEVGPNGKIRLCGDFKVTLNKFLKVEKYPLYKIEDMLATLGDDVHFTKSVLNQAYLQLPVDEKSQELLTNNTPKGLFQFLKLPMGFTSCPAIWQRKIEHILSGIEGVTIFIDDIGVTDETDEIHLQRLKQVLERLRDYNIRINKNYSLWQMRLLIVGIK